MTTPTMPMSSKEYLYLDGLKAFDTRSPDAADPTSLVVEVAILAPETMPVELDWEAAEWVNATTVRILIGEGTVFALAAGFYWVWLRVLGAVEQPERKVAQLTLT